MNKVFIPQEPVRRNKRTGELESRMRFEVASKFGETVVLLPPGRMMLSPQPAIERMKDKLRDFSDDDYLIAVGDPTAIAIAAVIAADNNRGKLKMLKWDKEKEVYISVEIDIYHRTGKE